ncbi:MAG: DNA polymerase I [Ruminococcaceae bacterium]|nr:DNA polymerase I [Oscillospiraceae bacterium]
MKKILAVDGNSIVNRAFYGVRPLSNKEGLPTNALFGMVSILEKNLETVKPDFAAIAFDLKAPTFRHEMYAAYKAGRRPTPEDLLTQLPLAKELATALGFTCLEKEGYEADDILGTLAKMAENEAYEAYILTGDRDALQLISDKVHVLLATNTETIDMSKESFFEKYGVQSTQFVDVKALMGDSSDNIPGVPGIGEKTALKLIAEYGDLDGIYRELPTAKHTPSVRAKLEGGKESAYLSQKLATIYRDVPLDGGLTDYAYRGLDSARALALFQRFEFNAFIKRFGLAEAKPDKNAETVPVVEIDAAELEALSGVVAVDIVGDEVYLSNGEWIKKTSHIDALRAFFTKNTAQVICHDAKRIYKKLETLHIHWRNCAFDTMLGAYVLNAAEGNFDLPRLALHYLGAQAPTAPAHLTVLPALYTEISKRIVELEMEKLLYEIEMPLAAVLTDMELTGFCVSKEGLVAYGEELTNVSAALAERIYYLAGGEFNIQSPKQLGEILFERLGLPHGKKTKTGYSTNAEVLEKLRPYHPIIEDILEYRQVTKLNSTYAEGLLKQIEADGRIHTVFKQTGTATGRLSSAEPNLQNIPIRTELGKELRRYFVAKKNDYLLIDADYSQIELRLLAALADDNAMLAAFAGGEDIHTATAANVFGVRVESVTPELRKRAKAVNFGILYGMGAYSLSEDLHISQAKAKDYIASYFAAYPQIDSYLKSVIESAYKEGFVTTLLGRRRYIPELKMQNKNMQHFGERVAMNSPIQGTAADIIKIAMVRVDQKLKASELDARLILQVHDELIVEASRQDAAAAREILVCEMENAVKLKVALKVGVAKGENWYDCH